MKQNKYDAEMAVYNTAKAQYDKDLQEHQTKKAQYDKDKAAYDQLVAKKAEEDAAIPIRSWSCKMQCRKSTVRKWLYCLSKKKLAEYEG